MTEWTAGGTSFELDVENGTFTVRGDLEIEVEADFQRGCAELVEADASRLFVNLGEVRFISSACLGSLFLLQEGAKRRGIGVRVRLSRKISPICRMAGLEQVMDVEMA